LAEIDLKVADKANDENLKAKSMALMTRCEIAIDVLNKELTALEQEEEDDTRN